MKAERVKMPTARDRKPRILTEGRGRKVARYGCGCVGGERKQGSELAQCTMGIFEPTPLV